MLAPKEQDVQTLNDHAQGLLERPSSEIQDDSVADPPDDWRAVQLCGPRQDTYSTRRNVFVTNIASILGSSRLTARYSIRMIIVA